LECHNNINRLINR